MDQSVGGFTDLQFRSARPQGGILEPHMSHKLNSLKGLEKE